MLYYLLLPLAWVLFHLLFRIKVIGRENLKKVKTKGFISAPTHVSALDPVFVVLARFWGRRMIIFAKKELFEINFLVSWFMRQCGGVMVRGTRDEVDSMNRSIDYCRRGGGLLFGFLLWGRGGGFFGGDGERLGTAAARQEKGQGQRQGTGQQSFHTHTPLCCGVHNTREGSSSSVQGCRLKLRNHRRPVTIPAVSVQPEYS